MVAALTPIYAKGPDDPFPQSAGERRQHLVGAPWLPSPTRSAPPQLRWTADAGHACPDIRPTRRPAAQTPIGDHQRFLVMIPYWEWCSGGDLLSHNLAVAVPSALKGLASGFGMGPGVSLSL